MALSISTNTAALTAYQNLSTQAARQDEALSTASVAAAPAEAGDTVQFAQANRAAAASSFSIADADMAVQITHLAAAQIGANVAAATSAQANSSPDAVLNLLR